MIANPVIIGMNTPSLCHVKCGTNYYSGSVNWLWFYDGTQLVKIDPDADLGVGAFEFDMPVGLLCMVFNYKDAPFKTITGDAELIAVSDQAGQPVSFVGCYYIYGDCELNY